MKRINSILRAFFPTLNKRAEITFARATSTPTFKTQTESASLRLYATEVLVGDFVSSALLYCLSLALRHFGKASSVTRKCDHSSANARQVQLSR